MKRILFVDDEPLLLEVIEARFAERASCWEMDFSDSGQTALCQMFRKPYDIIVADMRMPQMDGIELLTLVMQRHPNTTRIMLSGQSDRAQTLRLVGTAHQYISKPCNLDELESAIDQALEQRDLLANESLKKLISQLQSLPSIPTLYLELVEELQRDDPSLERMAAIISRDLGMCSKMLQLVNSAFFGLPRKISNTEEAVGYLGIETVRALVLYLHIFSLYERTKLPGFSFERLWQHCWSVGVIARKIAQLEGVSRADTDDLFIAGLLHDVGQLVLVTGVPSSYQIALDRCQQDGLLLHEAESSVFGAGHAEVGAYLLGLWGLPSAIVEGVGWHHYPAAHDAKGLSPANVVHIANWISHQLTPSAGRLHSPLLDEPHLERVGMLAKAHEWKDAIAAQEAEAMQA
ncbi:MAG TPA: two-component system response regulator [Verrucomicrobiales bacterium]|nr:two-component system response regulator [Verrucomicrobiales bacterium]